MPHGTNAPDDRPGMSPSLAASRALSGRFAVLSAVAGLVLMGLSGYLFFAAAGVSAQVDSDARALLAAGGNGAGVVQWASVIDLFGYLLVAPLVAYTAQHFRDDPRDTLFTACGFAYVFAGALGACVFLAAGPQLMREYASATGAQRDSITTTFVTLYQLVVVGLWQILEAIPGGVWLVGIGLNLYRVRRRAAAVAPVALGSVLLLIAALRILGY